MDLFDLVKLTLRRWYVAAPVVVLTIAAAAAVGTAIRPEYRTSVAIVLVPPTVTAPVPVAGGTARPGNPWPRIGEPAMAQAVQISVSAYDARSRVRAAGGDPDYEVELVPRSSILTIEVSADTAVTASATVTAVTRLVHDEVAARQAQYRPEPGEQITTQILDPGRDVRPSRSNVLRLQIVVAALGLLLAAAGAVTVDAVLRHRARRTGRGATGGADHPDPGRGTDGADGAEPADQADQAAGGDGGPAVGDGPRRLPAPQRSTAEGTTR